MNITINGQAVTLADINEKNITQALRLYFDKSQVQSTFAVALNGDFVDKERYQQTLLSAKDRLDILFPIQGG